MHKKETNRADTARTLAQEKQSTQSVNNNTTAAPLHNIQSPPASPGNRVDGQPAHYQSTSPASPGISLVKAVADANIPKSALKPGSTTSSHSRNVPINGAATFTSPIKNLMLPRHMGTTGNTGIVRTSAAKSVIGLTANKNFRAAAEKSIREHKVYSICGMYPAIRNAMKKRGWIEKYNSTSVRPSVPGNNLHTETKFEDETDQAWLARMLREYTVDFLWVIRRDGIDWKMMAKEQIINRFPKAYFTTKVGLAACMQNLHWFSEAGLADTFFPRCYRLCLEEEKQAFIDDYRMSACLGYLKWLVQTYERDGEKGVSDPASKITILSVDFAVRQVNNYIRMRRHEDIDWLLSPAFMAQHWEVFLTQYYNVVQRGASKLRTDSIVDSAKHKYEAAKRALQKVAAYWPQLHVDGIRNIWICKPGARSRGKGIVVMNNLEKIMELLSHNNFRDTNWVVQKYIERPMLIYKTKFDIRQWFIIADWSPLTVWFYKESYIRFCTKPFSLEDFHESIHLCNNAVQCRYQNSELRDTQLPDENMWDCYTFQAHLKTLGKMDEWQNIYHGMKQSILGVLLASQETAEPRKGCFELYGADFMLSEDFKPWLIEINSCPCMAASTSVTARMCAQCLEDTIKVIFDRKEDRNAETGMFELIFRQNLIPNPQQFTGHDLIVSGTKLSRDIDWPSIMTKFGNRKGSTGGFTARVQKPTPHRMEFENGFTFNDLVSRLRMNEALSPYAQSLISTVNPSTRAAAQGSNRSQKTLEPDTIVTVKKIPIVHETGHQYGHSKLSSISNIDSINPLQNLQNRLHSTLANISVASESGKTEGNQGKANQVDTPKRSRKSISHSHSTDQKHSLKNGNEVSRLLKTHGASNVSNNNRKMSNVNTVTSNISSKGKKVEKNKTHHYKQVSRPSTSNGGTVGPAKSNTNNAKSGRLSSAETEKYGKIYAHSNDYLNLITDSYLRSLSNTHKNYSIDSQCTSEETTLIIDKNIMHALNDNSNYNSSASNQKSKHEDPSLPFPVNSASPHTPTSPRSIRLQDSVSLNEIDKKSIPEVQLEGDSNSALRKRSSFDLQTAYSQAYLVFPASPVHSFLNISVNVSEVEEANPKSAEAESLGEKVEQGKEEIISDNANEIVTENNIESSKNDVSIHSSGNDNALKLLQCPIECVSAPEKSEIQDHNKSKKKKRQDICCNCFSILCRCKGVAAVQSTNLPAEGRLTATNNSKHRPPSYRVHLEHNKTPVVLHKRSATTLPLKTINLNLT